MPLLIYRSFAEFRQRSKVILISSSYSTKISISLVLKVKVGSSLQWRLWLRIAIVCVEKTLLLHCSLSVNGNETLLKDTHVCVCVCVLVSVLTLNCCYCLNRTHWMQGCNWIGWYMLFLHQCDLQTDRFNTASFISRCTEAASQMFN